MMSLASAARSAAKSSTIYAIYRQLSDVRPREFQRFVRNLPIVWVDNLVRIGADGDGGYLVPDDFQGIEFCFSPGVAETASFEKSLEDRYGIKSFLADASVDGPPGDYAPAGFQKMFIGNRPADPRFITLSDWMETCLPREYKKDLVLQMDIEGSEYEVLLNTPMSTLERFRIICVEFHGLERLQRRVMFQRFKRIMLKLGGAFTIVHAHPNNNVRTEEIASNGQYDLPNLLEITFHKSNRVGRPRSPATFPHPLDAPNVAHLPSLVLGPPWVD